MICQISSGLNRSGKCWAYAVRHAAKKPELPANTRLGGMSEICSRCLPVKLLTAFMYSCLVRRCLCASLLLGAGTFSTANFTPSVSVKSGREHCSCGGTRSITNTSRKTVQSFVLPRNIRHRMRTRQFINSDNVHKALPLYLQYSLLRWLSRRRDAPVAVRIRSIIGIGQ